MDHKPGSCHDMKCAPCVAERFYTSNRQLREAWEERDKLRAALNAIAKGTWNREPHVGRTSHRTLTATEYARRKLRELRTEAAQVDEQERREK